MPFFIFFFLFPFPMLAFWLRSRTFDKPRIIKEEMKRKAAEQREEKTKYGFTALK